MNQEFAISAALLAWASRQPNNFTEPMKVRSLRIWQDAAAHHAGYTPAADPDTDIYRRLLERVTQWAHELGLDKAQQRTKDLAEFSADCADVYRMSGNRKAMRNFTRATAMYAEIYQTISDPDYWIEH